jgi:glycosyltransferase involved in cell wall biosynthesis
MTYRKPVIASAVGGVTDLVIDGKTGILVPPQDSSALAAAISRLLADPEFALRLGQAGHEHIQANYSWQTIIDRLNNLYQELLPSVRCNE